MPPIVMRLNRTWDAKCPPAKKQMIAGKFVPTVRGAFPGRLMQKTRRIAIEIHGPDNNEENKDPKLTKVSGSPTPKRGMLRSTETPQRLAINLSEELQDDDRVVIRILKPRKAWGFSKDSDDSSESEEEEEEDVDASKQSTSSSSKGDRDWVEYRKFGLDEIEDQELSKNGWEATMGLGANQERREIKFESNEQAQEFQEELNKLGALIKERAQARLEAFKRNQASTTKSIKRMSRSLSVDLSPNGDINLLVEIVSATDLPIADRNSTDPYVIVFMGKQEIHRTPYLTKTLNPIWTVDNGSLFIVSTSAEEFFSFASGLTFLIKDYDGLTSNESIARLEVPQVDLLNMTGDRTSFDLHVLRGDTFKTASQHFGPKLHLRVRPAETSDRAFMKQVFAVKKSKKLGVYADSSFVSPQVERAGLLKREKKVVDGVQLSRVKPRPDPSRAEDDTKWMTGSKIMEEAMKPTRKWIDAGTGGLAKLYLEVIKCDNLPNMDNKMEGKTDAFCCIIFEDAIVNTDVINDELSPRWVPWSQRGFVFRVAHPSSQVLVGVFDYDSEKGVNSHDTVGRVSIDITNFRANTEYLLTYDLYRSALDNERKTNGTITVRLRLEYKSYRDFVKGSLQLPALNYINLPKKQDFKTSYFVCNGEENLQKFDMDAITAYRTELEGYMDIFYYVTQALITILLWRGHFEIRIFHKRIYLPIHSMIAFVMGIFVIDNFNLIPSFGLFSIAWLLLATNEQRQRKPSPWHATMTYMQMWYAVLANKAPPIEIADHENEAAIRTYELNEKLRREEKALKAKEAQENASRLNDFLTEEVSGSQEAFDKDHGTKLRSVPTMNPLAVALLPIQKILGHVCKALRIVSSIVMWDESIYSFIIVNSCLALGIALIWVPWGFFIRWTLRILIWLLLGPWMKLLDIFYIQKMNKDGESDAELFKQMAKAKLEAVGAAREMLMMKKEEITKLRAMKKFMFGKFVTRVPQFKEYRYPDVPRTESSAAPIKSYHPPVTTVKKSHGQTLVGHMIPTWGDAVDAKKEAKEEKDE